MSSRHFVLCALMLSLGTVAAHAQDQLDHPVGQTVGYKLDTGLLDNPADEARTVYSQVITVHQSAWVRLFFSNAELAPGSVLRVTSLLDNEVQVLDAEAVELWANSTAYFNGDSVRLEVLAAPRSKNNRVVINQVTAESLVADPEGRGGSGQCGICGADNRTASAEAWSGRLMPVGCTASIFCEDSTLVSAGHCIQSNLVIQFNVPATQPNCNTVNPPVADQFPIIQIQSQNGGVGADWAVLRTGANNLGQTAYQRQNDIRHIASTPAETGQLASMWGYGLDTTCSRSQTQQHSPGTISSRTSSTYRFNNDVRGGNSGSGYILDDRIIGIVTHCNFSCTNVATRHDIASFTNARNNLALCDNTYTISVLSLGANDVPIHVAPSDTSGEGDGDTSFTRVYPHFTTLTLVAPFNADDACFVHWTLNGAPVPGDSLTFTVTGAATAIAHYAPCCDCDWNADLEMNSQDFFDFLSAFFDGNADFNTDDVTNSQDFFDFLSCFFAGC